MPDTLIALETLAEDCEITATSDRPCAMLLTSWSDSAFWAISSSRTISFPLSATWTRFYPQQTDQFSNSQTLIYGLHDRDINAGENIKRFVLADALSLKRPVGQQLFELKLAELSLEERPRLLDRAPKMNLDKRY